MTTTTDATPEPAAEAAPPPPAADVAEAVAEPPPVDPVAVPGDEPIDPERLMHHDYDGIREYDNPLPSWWSLIFVATIVFSFGYWVYYHVTHTGRSPDETYKHALAGWQASYKGPGGPTVSEDMLAGAADNGEVLARGAEVFAARCTGCHTADGRGQIGPNLTDLYQIHGSTRLDIYATVVGGAQGTAMIAWGEVLKPQELVSVTAFVITLRGKNLAGKEPQGKPVQPFPK